MHWSALLRVNSQQKFASLFRARTKDGCPRNIDICAWLVDILLGDLRNFTKLCVHFRQLPNVTSDHWQRATSEQAWSCNGENSLSFFTFWELMDFLRRRVAPGGARRYPNLMFHRYNTVTLLFEAMKVNFQGIYRALFFHDSHGSGRKQWCCSDGSHTIAEGR